MRPWTRGFAVALAIVLSACGTAAAQPEVVRSGDITVTTTAPVRRPGDPCDRLDRLCWERHIWNRELARRADAAWRARVEAYFAALRRAEAQRRTGYGYVQGIQVCNGGDLPTCGIVNRESRFNPRAENPASTASGLYQFLDGTWRGCPHRGGVGHASSASVATQVACARWLWAGGRGRSHWNL